ncbi:TPA: glycosyltransferase family 2 protein [Candidatus Beckwithbacteria bacterium]|nr:glycosyltransferase family 2 protein [Candidatus Beckwithbacteria bacterium]
MKLSLIVITKNNQDVLPACLKSARLLADEIIVIDDFSTDKTASLARKSGAKIYAHKLTTFAAQRNFGLKKATNSWILFVDSDEVLNEKLQSEIMTVVINGKTDGYFIKRTDYFLGSWLKYGETGNIKLLRLGKKGKGPWQGRVHERWEIKGKKGVLQHPLKHYPHQSVTKFLTKINHYSDIVAQYKVEQGIRVSIWQIFCFPLGKFIHNYIFRLGFLDGTAGFIMAAMMSFHSFLCKGKQYLLMRKKL